METSAINLVRNGNFVEHFEGWDHLPAYPELFTTVHRGRSSARCRATAGYLQLHQTIESVEPGRYIASLALTALKQPPHRLTMSVILPDAHKHMRVWYYKDNWEGHWLEFDLATRGQLVIEIISNMDATVADNDLILTDIAVRRLGDLPSAT